MSLVTGVERLGLLAITDILGNINTMEDSTIAMHVQMPKYRNLKPKNV